MNQRYTGMFTPTARDAAAGMRTLWTWYLFKPVTFIGMVAFFAIIAVMLIAFSYLPVWVILTATGLALPITLALALFVMAPMTGRKLYRQTEHLAGNVDIAWDIDGIELSVKRGHSSYAWSDFYRWGLSQRYLMLFLGEALSIMIPRTALGDGELAALEGLRKAGVRKY